MVDSRKSRIFDLSLISSPPACPGGVKRSWVTESVTWLYSLRKNICVHHPSSIRLIPSIKLTCSVPIFPFSILPFITALSLLFVCPGGRWWIIILASLVKARSVKSQCEYIFCDSCHLLLAERRISRYLRRHVEVPSSWIIIFLTRKLIDLGSPALFLPFRAVSKCSERSHNSFALSNTWLWQSFRASNSPDPLPE